MNLPEKSSPESGARGRAAGYAMAALLVAMSVMSIMLSVALPTWSHMIRREQEEELIFRGQQYARAINQYQRRYANQSPASIDVLIEQRFLRKKFKDPLSPDKDGEFQLLYVQNQMPGPGQGTRSRATGARGGGSQSGAAPNTSSGPQVGTSIGPSAMGKGPIVGVASKNTGQSIRLYNGKNRYNEWQFIGMEMSSQAGGGAPGGAPGDRSGSRGRLGGPGGGRSGGGPGGTFMRPDGRSGFPPPGRGGPPSR